MNIKMKKKILFALLILSANVSIAQFNSLVKDSVYSNVLKEQRPILVYLPKDYVEKKDSTTHYPVLYVLDGASHFLSISGLINELAETSRSNTLPKMIIVCINNTKRTRDLTPYPIKKSEIIPEEIAKETGGAEQFTTCIKEEIIPYIESKYRVTGYRALIGHSFGGIFALNILAKHKEMFDDYLVIDPSTWYDDRKFSHQVLDSLSKNNYSGKSLFIAIANTTSQKDTSIVKKSKEVNTEHERSIIEFNARIKLIKNNLNYSSKYYPEDDHQSVPAIAKYDGLRFFFKGLKFSLDEIHNPSFIPRKRIPEHFEKLSKKLKYKMDVPTSILEGCYKDYAEFKDEKRKEEVLQLYKDLYPVLAQQFIEKNKK